MGERVRGRKSQPLRHGDTGKRWHGSRGAGEKKPDAGTRRHGEKMAREHVSMGETSRTSFRTLQSSEPESRFIV